MGKHNQPLPGPVEDVAQKRVAVLSAEAAVKSGLRKVGFRV